MNKLLEAVKEFFQAIGFSKWDDGCTQALISVYPLFNLHAKMKEVEKGEVGGQDLEPIKQLAEVAESNAKERDYWRQKYYELASTVPATPNLYGLAKIVAERLLSSPVTHEQSVIARVFLEFLGKVLKKNADYGSSVFTVPSLCPIITAEEAIRVRMSDKLQRLTNLFTPGRTQYVSDESKDDTLLDFAAYILLRETEKELRKGKCCINIGVDPASGPSWQVTETISSPEKPEPCKGE